MCSLVRREHILSVRVRTHSMCTCVSMCVRKRILVSRMRKESQGENTFYKETPCSI
jgi:hypothetical protein